ncbi:MAG: SDR family oxidoreductase [Betaproteobacteria bacterium]|nr:SDR family oxidoreductase [Betaproteobacteria bacterium]
MSGSDITYAGRFDGRVAIVTGGAMGIGGAAARRLAREGATVVIADLDEKAGAENVRTITETGGKAGFVTCNVTDEAAVRALMNGTLATHGRIDILANVAGVSTKQAAVYDMPLEEFRRVTRINIEGTFLCTKYAARAMMARKYGRIINISSTTSIMPTSFGNTPYTASKGAVSALTRQWVMELAEHGITVNAVAPGPTRTPLTEARGPKMLADREKLIPCGRIGEPEDQAAAIAFLASDDASYINGQVLVVDGGLTVVRNATQQ